ncbi:G-type lectin S-receptor-like serine/threonine-protein kinase At4g27290 [Cynara cardunculus var. scolymus]|uniref:G-type lectin S-receptor-like serine/threonine-protein kinase At4g27290 n=1 Tax=Cynara cardunculus var. scolymus TaxID=59895 RepID=UPI000D62F41D|nr:G-type lectin S-receptor-like serine/threonine-protein kinase At4g27290 [Cynara cardunculus var. scolymus]
MIVIPIGVTVLLLGVCLFLILKKRNSKAHGRRDSIKKDREESQIYDSRDNDLDLPLFSLSTLLSATNNFSFNNKLGEGGFGPVYKGFLDDGREIAVKRLSDSSTQGVEEFKNEVIVISKLQHRNLVRILGCCVEGQEKMLVYEYMPNNGLDLFLFQEAKRKTLNWTQRFHIINGIARGLLYLHQDSRLRIIHRDLKAANILLDRDMNPKISDFGMARSFGGNDNETNTNRVVGTYGYMSPEYAGDGIFSVKSDVFSFGVLVLEIVSGQKNRGFFHQAHHHNLLGHAWRLYKEEKTSELVDASLDGSMFEVLRSIHVALLCVQNNPDDRPTMSTVIMMLSSDGPLPIPRQPGFYTEDTKFGPENSASMQTDKSNNEITITLLNPRYSMKMEATFIFVFFITFSFYSLLISITAAADTIAVNQTIRDGETIVSPQQTFELGFFTPGNATQNRYLGIWYKRQATGTVAWVANREIPIRNNSGELTLHSDGVLVLRDSTTNTIVWSTSSPGTTTGNPVARLSDSGNLVVVNDDNEPENYIWQSFDHPGDTVLPGMKFGRDLEKGIVTNVTSWKSVDDPSQGTFMVYMDFNGCPQIFIKDGDVIQHRLGIWNGIGYTGMPTLKTNNPIFTYEYVSNENVTYSVFNLINASVLTKTTINPSGDLGWFNWIDRTHGWFLYLTPAGDNCARYALCGVYGRCDIQQSQSCECLRGFTPKRPDQWDISDWSDGCQREIPLNCSFGEGFRKYSSMKLPDTRQSWYDTNMSLEQCRVKCRNECNCTAYTQLDIKYNTGCLLWYDELIDMRTFPNTGQDIYIKMAAAELDMKVSRKKKQVVVIAIPVAVGLGILLGVCLLIIRKKMNKKLKGQVSVTQDPIEPKDVINVPLFKLSALLVATDNFSLNNKLGEGGFGPVYKGFLEDGQEIAVKRLSTNSLQGVEEFKNEVTFISNLQHRNLVKILGCCVEGQEQMLIYEYMPNKGLDLFLFDETISKTLGWSQRFHIINGIARGLLYLHQDSRLRIIHRDLKAANILLDHDMNPKISDFGLARSFRGNETETNTIRVMGTYGYMSPEYAGDGIFSVKSDVFSFGVLVLEITSGKKNRGFSHEDHNHNLLGHAWRLHREGKALELVDESLIETGHTFEVLLSIRVALLCVQHDPRDRPNMSTVVMMLSGDESRLPEPKQPGFYKEDDRFGPENSSSMQTQNSNNDVTITLMDAR